jgi:hypothetical protein
VECSEESMIAFNIKNMLIIGSYAS